MRALHACMRMMAGRPLVASFIRAPAALGSVRSATTAAATAPPHSAGTRAWVAWAIAQLNADAVRSADTHLIPVPLPGFPAVDFYLKDESSHPTGSLKHRLARSLFLYALVNGWLVPGGTVIESSSGSTAVSEAYFAKLLGLKYVAVMPAGTSPAKVALIERFGGEPHFVAGAAACAGEAMRLAATTPRAHFLDQFTYAERATDFRGNNNLAASLFAQMAAEAQPVPAYVICGAGTGGTSATLGRYVRYRGVATEVVIADPERSAFFDYFVNGDAPAAAAAAATAAAGAGGRIEGIGRPRAEPSFVRTVVDGAVAVPDVYSVGAMAYLERALGRRVGGSTGTIFCGALTCAERMRAAGVAGSIVGILCDSGERYKDTLFHPAWRAEHGLDAAACEAAARDISALADPAGADDAGAGNSPWRRAGAAAPPATRLGSSAWPMTLARRRDSLRHE